MVLSATFNGFVFLVLVFLLVHTYPLVVCAIFRLLVFGLCSFGNDVFFTCAQNKIKCQKCFDFPFRVKLGFISAYNRTANFLRLGLRR